MYVGTKISSLRYSFTTTTEIISFIIHSFVISYGVHCYFLGMSNTCKIFTSVCPRLCPSLSFSFLRIMIFMCYYIEVSLQQKSLIFNVN